MGKEGRSGPPPPPPVPKNMTNNSHMLPGTYLSDVEGLSGWLEGPTGWRAGDVLARLLVQLQLRQ